MQFCPKNRDDLVRYFKGTYVKFREYGDQLFFIEEISSMAVKGLHQDGERFILYLNDETPYELEYILPHKSFFQYGADAMLLERVPARQYYRGLCGNNTSIRYLTPDGLVRASKISFELLKAFVSKQAWASLSSAINARDKYTVALSPRMMFRRSNKTVYIDFQPAAKVNTSKLTVNMLDNLFLDEMKGLLALRGETSWRVEPYTPPPPKEKTNTDTLLKEMGQPPLNKKKTFINVPLPPIANIDLEF